MKIQFDPKQQYQLDAVASVVDLFDGQQLEQTDFSVVNLSGADDPFTGVLRADLGVGNRLSIPPEEFQANTRAVQERNEIEVADPAATLEAWEVLNQAGGVERHIPHFSVEMETGTGKTYVYLRTIFELSRRYGFKKFIIVVPSVAIREGVLKNMEITQDHFRALYNNAEFEYFVYDAKKVNKLRQFAVSNTIQVMVINIQAFNKKDIAVIYKESDKLSGRQPMEFVQATAPIVIIDEPQSVEGGEEGAGLAALKQLNPLCTLRYSATHRNQYNLIYRLDPIRAFELRLVKQIVVASVTAEGGMNDPYVRVVQIDNKSGIRAKLRIHAQGASGPIEKPVTVKGFGADLYELSGNRENYRDGFVVAEINAEPGNESIRFDNGRTLRLGEELGGLHEDVWRMQIKQTVKKHLEKELQVQGTGLKVLSLFFIDRVANYRSYGEDGQPVKGKFAEAFEQVLAEHAKDPRFDALDWLKLPVESVHDGYFAQDRHGVLKDTGGNTLADDDAYNLIMRDKERLLALDVPLRFIFSHSALREGWDNPNVFQICTLNETHSVIKKRQEIGRGLRIPVNQDGERVFDDSINKLMVVANESYEEFARALQTEYEEDCGVTFGKISRGALAKIVRVVEDTEQPIGQVAAGEIWGSLVASGMINDSGKIQAAFDPARPDFALGLPANYQDLDTAVIDLVSNYRIERHVRNERQEVANRLKKEVQLTPEFEGLWSRIKPRTTYRVEFESDDLVNRAVSAIKQMEPIQPAQLNILYGGIEVRHGGVRGEAISGLRERVEYRGPLPDILAYLQNQTELTRSTLARILKESGRLAEFFVNPQRFMDAIASILKYELHRLLVSGVKYERIPTGEPNSEWEMMLFHEEELVNYLTALAVNKSVYPYIPYDSSVERDFAEKLDQRTDIKLFVKLPDWFKVETPVGTYNPDWAIVKHDDETIYLVRETKDKKDFLKLRTTEADKVRCGAKHFAAIGMPFAVVVAAAEV